MSSSQSDETRSTGIDRGSQNRLEWHVLKGGWSMAYVFCLPAVTGAPPELYIHVHHPEHARQHITFNLLVTEGASGTLPLDLGNKRKHDEGATST